MKYILSMVNTFLKYIWLFGLKRSTTKTILEKIEKRYISEVSKSKSILTDNGTQFTTIQWVIVIGKKVGTIRNNTKICYKIPFISKPNREIGRTLRIYCSTKHTKWPIYLSKVKKWKNQLRSSITEVTLKGKVLKSLIENQIEFSQQPTAQQKEELIQEYKDKK